MNFVTRSRAAMFWLGEGGGRIVRIPTDMIRSVGVLAGWMFKSEIWFKTKAKAHKTNTRNIKREKK